MRKLFIFLVMMFICVNANSAQFLYKDVCLNGQGDAGGNCDYTTLESCMNANEQDLTGDGWFDVEIKGAWSGNDTTNVIVHNYTTTADDYINIFTNGNARHDGTASKSGAYKLKVTGRGIYFPGGVAAPYITIDGLVIDITSNGNYQHCITAEHILNSAFTMNIKNNVLMYSGGTGNGTSGFSNCTGSTLTGEVFNIYNNIVYGFDSANYTGMYLEETVNLFNNTAYGCYNGFWAGDSTIVAKNNISYNNSNADFLGTFSSSSTHNASSDTTAPEFNTWYDSISLTFADAANGDFHLVAGDTDAIDKGTDLSGIFTTDIDGDTRTDPWDIGADEYVSSVSPIIKLKGDMRFKGDVRFFN